MKAYILHCIKLIKVCYIYGMIKLDTQTVPYFFYTNALSNTQGIFVLVAADKAVDNVMFVYKNSTLMFCLKN